MTGCLKFSIPTALVLVCTGAIRADVALPPVFSAGMVLQAELAVPVFGTAADGEKVTVEFAGQKKSAVAKDGKWKIMLDPVKSGSPVEMKIIASNSLTIKNILVGEVWLASGQSNMKFPLARASDAQEEIAKADFAKVRYFVAPGGPWVAATPKTVGGFSAAAYYFAVNLHLRLQRPVGIIDSSVNGAVAQRFISRQAIEASKRILRWPTH